MKKDFNKSVVIVAPYFPPHPGGLERYAFEIAKKLNLNHQWRVTVVTSGERHGLDVKEEVAGLTIYRLAYSFKISNTPFSFSWFFKIKKIFKVVNPDIVHIHTPVPGIGDIAALCADKKPIIVTYHAGSMHKGSLLPDVFIYLYEHFFMFGLLRHARQIICSSDFVRFSFLNKFTYKSSTITPGVDTKIFKSNPEIKSTEPRLLFVGGLGYSDKHKGLQTLLEALILVKDRVPDIRLTVVGCGDMVEEYKQNVKNMGLEEIVEFTGVLAGEGLVREYQRATAFVLPTKNDSFAMVILEAMACSLPVVSTTVGGIPSLVKNGETGFLVAPDNPTAIAEKIVQLLTNPKLISSFGEAGRDKVMSGFDWETQASRYNNIFEEELNQKKRLAIVAPYFYPKTGGVENYSYNLARRAQESGLFKVSIITGNHESGGYKKDEIDGMTVHRLPVWGKVSNTPVNLFWYWWFKKIYKIEKPDIINAHMPVPFMADMAERARGRVPFVLTYHNDIIKQGAFEKNLAHLAYTLFINRTIRKSEAIITTSEYYANKSKYLKGFENKISFVPPGVDLSRLSAATDRAWLKQKYSDLPTVLFVGRLDMTDDHKGLEILISAIKQLQESGQSVQLVIVGTGNAINKYQALVKTQKLKGVVFAGRASDEELPRYFAGADLTVLPSISDSEGFGMVLLEANACGRPAIGSNIGGIPYIIEHEKNGLLVSPKDVNGLCTAILRILTDQGFANKLGGNGVVKASQFSWELQTKEYLKILTSLVNAKPAIVQVAAYYPPHLGGLERVVEEVSEQLSKDGYSVTVLTSNIHSGGIAKEVSKQNLKIKRLWAFDFAHTAFIPALFGQLFLIKKPAIFHLHLAQAFVPEIVWLVSKLRGIPYVIHYHLDVERSGPLGFIFDWYKRYVLPIIIKGAAQIITLSEEQTKLISERHKVSLDKIIVISNGVGQKFLNLGEGKRRFNNPLRLVFVGRLARQKRPERLIEAISLVKSPVILSLVGDGEDAEELRQQTKKLGLKNVFFKGVLRGEELLKAYEEADVFVLPSDKEGMPLAALEAMAAGLPVVGSDVLGIHELINGVGVLVGNPSPKSFADAIESLIHSPEQLEDLSRKSYAKAQEYSWKKLVGEIEKVYIKPLS